MNTKEQKQLQYKPRKYGCLNSYINDYEECEKLRSYLKKSNEIQKGLYYVNDPFGDYDRSILYLEICDDIYSNIQELIDEIIELDQTGEQPIDAYTDGLLDSYLLLQNQIKLLIDFMENNELDFMFI